VALWKRLRRRGDAWGLSELQDQNGIGLEVVPGGPADARTATVYGCKLRELDRRIVPCQVGRHQRIGSRELGHAVNNVPIGTGLFWNVRIYTVLISAQGKGNWYEHIRTPHGRCVGRQDVLFGRPSIPKPSRLDARDPHKRLQYSRHVLIARAGCRL